MKKISQVHKPAQGTSTDQVATQGQAAASCTTDARVASTTAQIVSSNKLKQSSSIGESPKFKAPSESQLQSSHEKRDQQASDYEEDSDDSMGLHRFDQEVCLPKATVNQMICDKLPEGQRMSNASKELLIQLSMQFLNQITDQANIVCSARNKKTVFPDHVIDAMKEMKMQKYLAKIALQKSSVKAQNAFLKQSDKIQKQKILDRLVQAESGRRPFGKYKSRSKGNRFNELHEGLTEAQLVEEQQRLLSVAADNQPNESQQQNFQPQFFTNHDGSQNQGYKMPPQQQGFYPQNGQGQPGNYSFDNQIQPAQMNQQAPDQYCQPGQQVDFQMSEPQQQPLGEDYQQVSFLNSIERLRHQIEVTDFMQDDSDMLDQNANGASDGQQQEVPSLSTYEGNQQQTEQQQADSFKPPAILFQFDTNLSSDDEEMKVNGAAADALTHK